MWADTVDGEKCVLNLARVDVHATNNEHVVGAAENERHARVCPTTDCRLAGDRAEVTRPVPQYRKRLLREARQHQDPNFAVRQSLAGVWVDDFGQEVIFHDHEAVSVCRLARHARPDHFGQAVDIDRNDAETGFDCFACRIRPRLSTEDPDLQRTVGSGVAE